MQFVEAVPNVGCRLRAEASTRQRKHLDLVRDQLMLFSLPMSAPGVAAGVLDVLMELEKHIVSVAHARHAQHLSESSRHLNRGLVSHDVA